MEFLLRFFYSPIQLNERSDEIIQKRKNDQKIFEEILVGLGKNQWTEFLHFFENLLKINRLYEMNLRNIDIQSDGIYLADLVSPFVDKRIFVNNQFEYETKSGEIISTNLISPFLDKRIISLNNQLEYKIQGYEQRENKVYIFNSLLDESDIFFTLCSLPSLSNLKILVLNNIVFKLDLFLILLTRVLGSLVNLNELGINNCQFPLGFTGESESYSAFAVSLKLITDLRVFSFLNNKVDNKNLFKALEDFYLFKMWQNLENFRIGWVGKRKKLGEKIEYQTYEYIQNKLNSSLDCLTNEITKYLTVEPISEKFFIDKFMNCRKLKELHLNDLENIKISSFAELLNNNENLTFLDLSGNKLGKEHISYAVEHVNKKVNIEVLILNNNNLRNPGFWKLIELACNHFENLRMLSADNNKILDAPINAYNFNLTRLEKISLSHNSFKNSFNALFNFLQKNFEHLNCIILKDCGLNEKFLDDISNLRRYNLVFVDLRMNGIAESKKKHIELVKKYKSLVRSTKNFEKSCILVDYPRNV